jgi:hypothetical protein
MHPHVSKRTSPPEKPQRRQGKPASIVHNCTSVIDGEVYADSLIEQTPFVESPIFHVCFRVFLVVVEGFL